LKRRTIDPRITDVLRIVEALLRDGDPMGVVHVLEGLADSITEDLRCDRIGGATASVREELVGMFAALLAKAPSVSISRIHLAAAEQERSNMEMHEQWAKEDAAKLHAASAGVN
jgi:hypothetical protein